MKYSDGKVGKGQFIHEVWQRLKEKGVVLKKAEVKVLVDEVFQTLADLVAEGKEVSIAGYILAYPNIVPPKRGFNPRTKEKVEIPAMAVGKVKFSPSMQDNIKEKLAKKWDLKKILKTARK